MDYKKRKLWLRAETLARKAKMLEQDIAEYVGDAYGSTTLWCLASDTADRTEQLAAELERKGLR